MPLEDRALGSRIWRRLADRTRVPRRWWNPLLPYRRLSRDVLADAYTQYAETTNRTMLALLAVGTFCLLTVLSTPDKALLATEGTVKVPFAEASISFFGFVIVAPLLLIVVLAYLHIFYGYWLDAERERQEYNRVLPEVQKTPVEPVAVLFALADPVPRFLTSCVFYYLAPIVLAEIAWKGLAVPSLGFPLLVVFCIVTLVLIFLRIRRSAEPAIRFQRVTLWLVFTSVVVFALYLSLILGPEGIRRPLNLFRAELTGVYLASQDLREANLRLAKLKDANLQGANLQGANLHGADLQGADLHGANLRGANLHGANLRGVMNLTKEQVVSALTDKSTQLPDSLK